MDRNPYQVLQVEEDASFEQIKNRYNHLTKRLHPDKNKNELAKKSFEQIDKAYKSIETPLRRYLFFQFGSPAIDLIDNYPNEFLEFIEEQLNHQLKLKLKQKVIYMLYEEHANGEVDRNKITNKTVVNIRKVFTQKTIPEIEKCDFDIEIPLPQYKEITSTFTITNQTSHLSKQQKSHLQYAISASKRLDKNFVLSLISSVDSQQHYFNISIQKIIKNSLHIRFSPVCIHNGNFQYPRFGFDKSFKNFTVSAITDLTHINIEVNGSENSKLSKSIKLICQKNGLAIIPKIQYTLSDKCQLFTHITASIQKNNQYQARFGLAYGYRLKIYNQLKIQLSSHVGLGNFFQFTIITPKFKVNIPIINNAIKAQYVQMLKLVVFLGVYFNFQLVKYIKNKNTRNKKKLIKIFFTRLVDQRSLLTKLNSNSLIQAQQCRQKQIRYCGLLIFKAFIGSSQSIKKLIKFIQIQSQSWKKQKVQQQYQLWNAQIFKQGNIQDQLYDITNFVQSKVIGSTLINFNYDQANPCIKQQQKPLIYISYWLRGKRQNKLVKFGQKINIGIQKSKKNRFIQEIKNILRILF